MPPKPRSCAYILRGGKPCPKPAVKGSNPPACLDHDLVEVEDDDYEEDDGYYEDLVGVAVDEVLANRKVRSVLDKGANLLDKFAQIVDRAARQQPPPPPRPQGPRPTNAPPFRPRAPREDPRTVLGFAPGQQLTVEIVKERKRELARLYHPDRGGSLEGMQRINVAADELIARLGKSR